jgi:hypothetical protein
LSEEDRKILQKPSKAKKVAANPITLEVNGEIIRFEPYDPTKEKAVKPRDLFIQAVEKLQTQEDWDQLPRLLEGLRRNKTPAIYRVDYTRLIRWAGRQGRVSTIMRCVANASKTGFKIDTLEKADGIMQLLVQHAADNVGSMREVSWALRQSELVLELAEQEGHQFVKERRHTPDPRFPLHADPQLLCTPLLLSSVLALREESTELIGKVLQYARTVTSTWPEATSLRQLHGHGQGSALPLMVGYLQHPAGYVRAAAPVLSGLYAAIDVLQGRSSELAPPLSDLYTSLEKEFVEEPKKDERAMEYYDKVRELVTQSKEIGASRPRKA